MGVWYMTFSLVYYYAGGTTYFGTTYIYKPLDWSKPGPTSGVVIACFFGILIIHCLVYGLYRLRVHLWRNHACGKHVDDDAEKALWRTKKQKTATKFNEVKPAGPKTVVVVSAKDDDKSSVANENFAYEETE